MQTWLKVNILINSVSSLFLKLLCHISPNNMYKQDFFLIKNIIYIWYSLQSTYYYSYLIVYKADTII
jgi:hypothetical protein